MVGIQCPRHGGGAQAGFGLILNEFYTVFFANAGVVGAKDKKTKGAKLVGDIEAGEFMETLRVNTLRYSNSFLIPNSIIH